MDTFEKLCSVLVSEDWPQFVETFKPKDFIRNEVHEMKIERRVVAKMSEILTKPDMNLPTNVTMIILKCLTNSCMPKSNQLYQTKTMMFKQLDDYMHLDLDLSDVDAKYKSNCYNKLYEAFAKPLDEIEDAKLADKLRNYPTTRFYYDGIVEWIINFLLEPTQHEPGSDEDKDCREITRVCFSFLCNITAIRSSGDEYPPRIVYEDDRLPSVTKSLLVSECSASVKDPSILRAVCSFLNNVFAVEMDDDFFYPTDLAQVTRALLTADEMEINAANSALISLTNRSEFLSNIYDELPIDRRLYLLEMIYQNIKQFVYQPGVEDKQSSETTASDGSDLEDQFHLAPDDAVQFLTERFKNSTDLILKSANVDEKTVEPVEVTIILDILGALTSTKQPSCAIVKNDTSLLINATYLLRGIQMAGKEQGNYFSPVQKLSELAPNAPKDTQSRVPVEDHPAFGFKAALIRLIGNLVYKHQANQDTVREIDGIPLLLDCCNIDARNPLIIQWTILAIRNLCESNLANQNFINNSNKIKFVDSQVIRELGLTLSQDESGNGIGIIPLPKTD